MFKKAVLLGLTLGIIFLFIGLLSFEKPKGFLSPLSFPSKPESKLLEKYSFENLSKRQFEKSEIDIEKTIKEEEKYTAYLFSFESEGKKVSGQLNLPLKGKNLPVVVMLRGYVDKEIYFTGLGTRKAAGFFAENGLITLAPDFLGFGRSDEESKDILLNRFKRPETVLNLLASVKNLNQALAEKGLEERVDPEKIFFWGHSNGGQVALSVLEISQEPIPATLWAPVSKPFPDSILQYASELEDQGKKVMRAIRELEESYNPAEYSITTYFNRIQAPLQVHQGTGDGYISLEDSDKLVESLRKLGKEVTYYVYLGDDHNLKKNWEKVVERDLEFFRSIKNEADY